MTKRLLGEIELNRIYQRDCIEGMRMIPDKSVDLVVTDPPYVIEAGGGTGGLRSGIFHRNKGGRNLFNYEKAESYMPHISRVAKESAHIYVFSNDKNLCDIIASGERVGLKLMNIIVVNKGNKVAFGWYMKQVEFVVLFRKRNGRAKQVNDMSVPNLLNVAFPKGRDRLHPSEKGVDLIKLFITQSSNEGEIVFDPFMGSGTTAVAATLEGRHWVGFEMEPAYVEITNKRLDSLEVPAIVEPNEL